LEKLPTGEGNEHEVHPVHTQPSKIIINAMVIVQQVASKETTVKSCANLAKKYIASLEELVADYDTFYLVFYHL
jgi:hypothetical protein